MSRSCPFVHSLRSERRYPKRRLDRGGASRRGEKQPEGPPRRWSLGTDVLIDQQSQRGERLDASCD